MFLCGELKILCGDEWEVDGGNPNNVSCIRYADGGEARHEIRVSMDAESRRVSVLIREENARCEELFRCEMEAYEYLEDYLLSNDCYSEWCHCATRNAHIASVLGKRKYVAG